MALETFDFPYFTFTTENPESGFRAQFGGSYQVTAPAPDPDLRIVNLNFPTMKYFLDDEGVLDDEQEPKINMFRLIKFYQRHKLYKSFHFQHPVHGLMEVRFNKPLIEPEGIAGGGGTVKDFSIQLIEVL